MSATTIMLAGRYRLDARIAVGGVGEVWRATDGALARPVAVKLLRAEYTEHPEALARFRAEARHAGALSHPGIARVYDYGEEDQAYPPYLVMELVDGPSLAEVLSGGPLDAARSMDVIAQTAAGLAAAHNAGLIHRDIKPANLLLSRHGRVKITDFGIAHAVGSAPLTRTGTLMGTPGYLAPERVAGASGTPAADLYALGVVGYECLAGRPPFGGDPVVVAIAHRDRPLPQLPAGVPAEAAALIADLTRKEPGARPSPAAEVARCAARLRDALTGRTGRGLALRPGAALPVPPPRTAPPQPAGPGSASPALVRPPAPAPAEPAGSALALAGPAVSVPPPAPAVSAPPPPALAASISAPPAPLPPASAPARSGPDAPGPAVFVPPVTVAAEPPLFRAATLLTAALFAAARLAARLLTAARSAADWRTAEPPEAERPPTESPTAGWPAAEEAAVPVKRPWQPASPLVHIRRAGSRPVWPVRSVVLAVTASALSAGLAGWLLAGLFQAVPPLAAGAAGPAGAAAQPGKAAARPDAASGTRGTGRAITVNGSALVGRPVGAVRERLRALGLQVRVQWRPQGHPRPGTVVALHPSGALPANSVVVVTVTASPAMVPAYALPVPPDRHGDSSGHGDNWRHWH